LPRLNSSMDDERSTHGPVYLGHATLRARGWDDALIRRFLPEPDKFRDNPFYRSHPPRRLYLLARVEAAEGTPEFLAARAQTASQGKSSAR
jgi:hypothetical protein